MDKLVSVVIPAYNAARYLPEAVGSVVAQTHRDLEIIVVDDGSTDGSRELLAARATDPRLRYHYQENRGLPAARNAGIGLARGDFIAFLDADDVWLPGKLEKQLALLRADPRAAAAYCGFGLIDEAGTPLENRWRPGGRGDDLFTRLLYGNVIAGSGSAVVVRASCFADVGRFDERLQACEDHDMWRRIAARHAFVKVEEELVRIRVHAASMQRNAARMQQGLMLHLEKILAETPPEHARHLPAVTRDSHRLAFLHWVRSGRFWHGIGFLIAQARRYPAIAPFIPWWAVSGLYRTLPEPLQRAIDRLR